MALRPATFVLLVAALLAAWPAAAPGQKTDSDGQKAPGQKTDSDGQKAPGQKTDSDGQKPDSDIAVMPDDIHYIRNENFLPAPLRAYPGDDSLLPQPQQVGRLPPPELGPLARYPSGGRVASMCPPWVSPRSVSQTSSP